MQKGALRVSSVRSPYGSLRAVSTSSPLSFSVPRSKSDVGSHSRTLAVKSVSPSPLIHRSLLRRLVWRAKEALLGELRCPPRAVAADDSANLITVDWSKVKDSLEDSSLSLTRTDGDKANGGSVSRRQVMTDVTLETSLTLLCELFTVALRERPQCVVQDFIFADVAVPFSSVKVPQAVTTPMTRQARLWTELREWHSLVACAAVTFRRMQTESPNAESLRCAIIGFLEKFESLSVPSPKGDKPSRDADRALSETLWRLALLYRVMGAVLRDDLARPGAERAIYFIAHEVERWVYRLGPPSPTHRGDELRGVHALLCHMFLRRTSAQRSSGSGGSGSVFALDEALHAFISAYAYALPLLCRENKNENNNEKKNENDIAGGIVFVRALRECWLAEQPAVRSGGARVAMWWLRLVPVLLEAFLYVTAQLSQYPEAKEPLETLQTELLSTLCAMLYFDEQAFENQRMQSNAVRSVAGTIIGKSGDDSAAECVRPRRGGRSLFKKGAEDSVILPSSAEAARKPTRFTSRRAWEAQGDDKNKNDKLNGGIALENSSLFDVIVCSRDTTEQLVSMFAVDQVRRSNVLEGTWLALLAMHRSTREALAPPREERTKMSGTNTSERAAATNTHTTNLPSFVLASVWHLSCALGMVTREVCEISNSTFTRDENVRRAVSLAVVVGTQEILLQNCFYMEGLTTNWWLLGGLLGKSNAARSLDSAIMFLVSQRQRLKNDAAWLRASTETVLRCLDRGRSFLSPGAKQWAGAFVVSNLLTAMRVHGDDAQAATRSGNSASKTSMEASHEMNWMSDAMNAMLTVLSEDEELLLLSCSASFLDLLYDVRRLLSDEVIMNFSEKVLLKSMLPALIVSLAKSADEDDTETHASACEAALFVLAELSRFTPRLITRPTARSGRHDEMLMSTALYCLRLVRRAGGRPTCGSGLSPPQLPNVDIPSNAGAAIAYLLQRGNRRSYLHVLDLGNVFVSPPRAAPLYLSRPRGSVAALMHYAQGTRSLPVSQHSKVVGEAIKFLDVLIDPQATRVMGSLVRFMESYLRQREHGAREVVAKIRNAAVVMEKDSHMKPHKNKNGHKQEKKDEEDGKEEERGEKGEVVSTLDRMEDAPLLLLDLMGHLSAAGTWSTVFWVFNVAEISLRIHRQHHLTAATTSLRDVATTAILTQLRSLSSQKYSTINDSLYSQIQRVVVCVSDAVSDTKMTLLGLDRGTLLQGLLRHTSRGEFRTVFFALKQAVVLVQRVSVQYRGSLQMKESHPFADTRERGNDEKHAKEDNDQEKDDVEDAEENDDVISRECLSYFNTTKHTLGEQQALRAFLGTLAVCFNGVLDVISSYALQQDVLDEDLRDALMISLHTLMHVLQGSIRALLDSEDLPLFVEERAAMLWVSLIVVAIMGRVISLDHSRVCFTEQTRTATKSLFKTIDELIDTYNGPSGVAVDPSTVSTKSSSKKVGSAAATSSSSSSSSSSLLLIDTLLSAIQHLQDDPFISYRVGTRFALTSRRRRDLTILVAAIRAMAAAAARHKPAGTIIHRVWRSLCDELSAPALPVKGKKRTAKTIRAASLTVPSREELSVALLSFADFSNDLNETAAQRIARQREADYVLNWTCESAASIVSSIGEDSSLLDADKSRDDNNSINNTLDIHSSMSSSSSSSPVLSILDLEATFLLDDEENSDSGTATNAEIVSAIVRQSSRMILSTSYTRRLGSAHLECVLRALERCTLIETLTAPRGCHVLRSLLPIARAKSPVPADRRSALWALLERKWGSELMPTCEAFDMTHRALTRLVRRRRGLAHQSGTEALPVSMGPFGLADNVMARLARHDAPSALLLPDLPPHDDPRPLAAENGSGKREVGVILRGPDARIPLDALFSMLVLLHAGPRGDVTLAALARTVAMYAARQHVLLRPRTDGDVVNVWGFLHSGAEAPGAGEDGTRIMAVLQRRGLPCAALHAEAVAGWFLSHADRRALEAVFAAESSLADVTRPLEERLFDYMRSSCLYLHLIALIVGAAVRHGVFPDVSRVRRSRPVHVEEARGKEESYSVASRSEERQREADARIGDSGLVSGNPLESLLLHFVNVACTMVSHADSVTHRATSIAIGLDGDVERARRALLYGDEIRLMVSGALQSAVHTLLQDVSDGYPLVCRVVHAVIGGFSCDATPTSLGSSGTAQSRRRGDHSQSNPNHSSKSHTRALPISASAMDTCRAKRPELFVRSPTLLCLLAPSFFNDVLAHHLRSAPGSVVTQVVASLHFHLSQKKAQYAQLMAATTTILSSTSVRNAALRLYCDELCVQMVERESFRDALAPPIVTAALRGSVPNEVLIPFLSAVAREDLGVAKHTLAAALHCAMGLRPDVFGHPPTQDRYAKLSIARRQNGEEGSTRSRGALPGSLSASSATSSALTMNRANRTPTSINVDNHSGPTVGAREQDDVDALARFQMDQSEQAAARTHKRALASLNLMLPEAMETAMHFAAMRRPTAEEYRKAMAMIRSADDARRERIEAFRSAAPATAPDTHNNGAVAPASHPDASLHVEDPTHFGVAILHVRFALRKIIHVSMRRLAAQQGPRTLCMMFEMLRAVDPKWHGTQGPSAANANTEQQQSRQSDSMLAGTLRVLMARAMICAEFTDGSGSGGSGAEEWATGAVAMSFAGLQRAERALLATEEAARVRRSSKTRQKRVRGGEHAKRQSSKRPAGQIGRGTKLEKG